MTYRGTEESFGACLMIKEDNSLLVEWLAYHYTVLPLRHVIIGSDLNNTQDPRDILQRWSNAGTNLNYVILNDTQFIHRHGHRKLSDFSDPNAAHHFFIHRQLGFITTCSEMMKRQGVRWVTFIDTDEFVVLNRLGKDDERFTIGGPSHFDSIQKIPYDMRNSIPPITSNVTVMDVINIINYQQFESNISSISPCYTMPRLIVGALENITCTGSEAQYAINMATSYDFAVSEMNTLRFVQHAKKGDFQANRFGKVMLDLSHLSEQSISTTRPKNPHRPYAAVCGPAMVHFPESLFYLNHYIGSWEQYSSRNDTRRNRQEWEQRAHYNEGTSCDKAVYDWFPRFVSLMGMKRAKYLLEPA